MNVRSDLLRIIVTHEIAGCWTGWANRRTRRPNLSGRKVMTDIDAFIPDVITFLLHKCLLLLPQRVLSLVLDRYHGFGNSCAAHINCVAVGVDAD